MSKIDPDKPLPQIHKTEVVAKSKLFRIEQMDLEFSNGETRQFERMAGSGRGAVMMVPFIDDDHVLLVREYAAGTHSYQLGFPKGLIDPGEEPAEAANRELMEEVGHGANKLIPLHTVSMAPTFFDANMHIIIATGLYPKQLVAIIMHIIIATGLYPKQLVGDEPEPLEVIPWPINDIKALLDRADFTEARSIVALLMAEKWIKENNATR